MKTIYKTKDELELSKSFSDLKESIADYNKNSGGYSRVAIIADKVCVTRILSNGASSSKSFPNTVQGLSSATHFIESSSAQGSAILNEVAA